MELTYFTSGGSGDAGDQYTGLDRFGRVVDQRWDQGGVDLERVKYGYDEASNQVWRQNTVAGTGQDEFYTQDGLYQLKTLQRGTLNGSKTGISGTPSWEEDWNHDPLGNWHGPSSGYETKVAGTVTLNQNRSHSQVNAISGITTGSGPAWTVPGHDAAGNLTRAPQPYAPTSGYDLMYDAWNRLVQVQVAGGALVAVYAYDGASRRVSKTNGGTVRHYYYDDQWRVVEERLNISIRAERRFTWGIRRLDDLILRDRILPGMGFLFGSGGSSSSGPTTERLYAVDDVKNVTGVVSTGGTVLERYGYNGFGGVRYLNGSFGGIPASGYDWETLFSSYRHDSESGLYQVRFRYLHPLLGRWTSRDPIEEREGNNLYSYVANNAINAIDPSGLSDNDASGALTAGAGAGAVLTYTGNTPIGRGFYMSGTDPNAFKGNTSVLFVYQKSNPKLIYRLDYGPIAKGPDATTSDVWHHNLNRVQQRLSLSVSNHQAGTSATAAGRAITIFKWGGRAMFVIGVANSFVDIYYAEDKKREIVAQVGGWGGAWAGAEVGAGLGARGGAWAGAGITSETGGWGFVPGAIVGGLFGGLVGGAAGFWAGSKITRYVYDYFFYPLKKEQWFVICPPGG
jgi:RHS repeat-associated protein